VSTGVLERDPAGEPRELAACRVAVLMGGRSSEREVSLASGAEVLRALSRAVAQARLGGAFGVSLEPDGGWTVDTARSEALSALSRLRQEADVCFLALHGGEGEDGSLQGLLAGAGIAHTGSGVAASALCMDKQATRALARATGVRVARGRLVARWAAERAELLRELPSPTGWFVKPRHGGSSVATSALSPAADAAALAAALDLAQEGGDDALVEERIDGIEVSCGVLGNRGEEPRALPPVEIRPKPGRFFDYKEKYSADGAREVCPPETLSPEAVARVQHAAARMHALCGCDGYSRVDFIVAAGDEPVLLELNTLPGLTPRSLLPKEAAAVGMDYLELCLWIVGAVLRRARHGGAA